MSTENINAQQELNNDELYNESTRRPWYHLIRGRSTCTANAYGIQHASKNQKQRPLKQERHCSCSTQQKSTAPNKSNTIFIEPKIYLNTIQYIYGHGNFLHQPPKSKKLFNIIQT